MRNLSSYATRITKAGDATTVRYHETDVISFTPTQIVVTLGGHDTVTARKKINQAAVQYNLPVGVVRKRGHTYLKTPQGIQPMDEHGVFLVNIG